MKILFTQLKYNYNNDLALQKKASYTNFQAKGQPLKLQYIVENRDYALPKRVLEEAKKILSQNTSGVLPSLLQIHKEVYAPLLRCKTLDEAKALYPEFSEVKEEIIFIKNNHYKRDFEERTAGENFALKMLKDYWGRLKTLREISQEYGMRNRISLEWPLEQINFPKFHNKYKNILLASDREGTKVLAKRVQDSDLADNSRKEKISASLYERWENNFEVRQAMSDFASEQGPGYRKMLDKVYAKKPLSDVEERMNKGFFKRFWEKYPHLKSKKSGNSENKYDTLA